jgi:hypothetical protein
MTDRDSGPPRTDAAIVARSEAALRWEMSEEGELKRALWAAREEIRKASNTLVDVWWHLGRDGLVMPGGSLSQNIEAVAQELLSCRAKVRRLEIQLERLKGGE